jgi:TolA-binding protein
MAMLKKFHSKQPPVKMAPHGLFLYGQAAAGTSDYSLSERKMSELVERFPEHALRNKAQYWVAEAKFRRKEYDSAERSFLELTTRLKPENRQSWMGMVPLRLAQIEAHRGQWRSALDKARAITGNYPGFRQQFEVAYLIGRCRASVGQFDAAREAYRAVLADSRANGKETAAMAQWMIGESYMHQRNYDQAVSEYLRVEVLHDWPEWRACGLFQAAKCYVAMNQKQPAIETFSRLMTRYPDSEYAGKSKLRVAALRSDAKPKVRVADRSEQNAKKSN